MAINIESFTLEDHEIPLALNGRLWDKLPFSLPLFRRCQFHLKAIKDHSDSNNSAEVWVSVVAKSESALPPDNTSSSRGWWLSRRKQAQQGSTPLHGVEDHDNHEQWLAAHIDLSNPGETQVWLFGSWESEQDESDGIQKSMSTSSRVQRIALFQALYRHLRQAHVKILPTKPSSRWQRLLNDGKIVSTPYSRSKILFGTVSETLWPYLEDNIVQDKSADQSVQPDGQQSPEVRVELRRTRQDLGYLKYLVPISTLTSTLNPQQPLPAPTGFRFGPLSDQQLQLMLDRSVIPRTMETLKSLVSVGLYPASGDTKSDPIAWGLLGKDASISSLHTEAEYRGRGLAEYITKELIQRQKDVFRSDWLHNDETNNKSDMKSDGSVEDIDEILYAHTDVSRNNIASRRVFEKMGAKIVSVVGWIEIDIGE